MHSMSPVAYTVCSKAAVVLLIHCLLLLPLLGFLCCGLVCNHLGVVLVWFDSLRPSQQLWSRQDGQFT